MAVGVESIPLLPGFPHPLTPSPILGEGLRVEGCKIEVHPLE